MALVFPYRPYPVRRPVPSLRGALVRTYPVFPLIVRTPGASLIKDGYLDSGADDTIFPDSLAPLLGLDLSQAPEGEALSVSGGSLRYRFAAVTLRLSDGRETCTWDALVGFVPRPLRWPLLGRSGFLQFFDAKLKGLAELVELEPNASFPGQYVVH